MRTLLLFTSSGFIMITAMMIVGAMLGKNLNLPSLTSRQSSLTPRALWLAQAHVKMTPMQFTIATTLCAFFTFIIVAAFSHTPLIALVVSIAAACVPYMFISKKRSTFSRELINAWPDALRDVSATIAAGHSLSFALHTLAQVGPPSISPHMARFSILERSMGFAAALEIVREEMNDATTDRIIEVLIVAQERGGRVVREIIDNLIEATTEDIALAETIATESIEMKINSRAVVILPWCVLFMLTLGDGVFRDFYQSSNGAIIIAIGALMSIAGIAILSRLTRTDLEARVFSSTQGTP